MTDATSLARAAGLGEPWKDRQAEIAEAIAAAARTVRAFPSPADERAEPMPAFVVPGAGAGA
jgi:hypothetical protein